MVYSRKIDAKTYTFGVSGRLYKSNVLLYDHQTESLWSQLKAQAVAGPLAGRRLTALPSVRSDWKTWRRRHPHADVLSVDTGFARDYSRDPYAGYYRSGSTWFPVGRVRRDLAAKRQVLGIEVNGVARAYPLDELRRRPGILEDRLGNARIRIKISDRGQVAAVQDARGRLLPHIFSYWFAWQAFHPRTSVYKIP